MKIFILIMSFVIGQLAYADECQKLMRSFFSNEIVDAKYHKSHSMDITQYGLTENPSNRLKFEKIYDQCLAEDSNTLKEQSSTLVSKINLGMTAATSVVGYNVFNWDKPKNAEWFERLGFNVVYGFIFYRIYQKYLDTPDAKYTNLIKTYFLSRVGLIGWNIFNGMIFEETNEGNLKLENNPKYQEDMEKLKAYASDSLIEKYKKQLMVHLAAFKSISLGIGVHEGVDFDNITPMDLNDRAIQSVLISAIAAQVYDNFKTGNTQTGDNFRDYLLLDSIYSLLKIPKDIIIGNYIDRIVCLSSANKKRGALQAIGIMTLNQIIFADYYGIIYRISSKE